MSQHLALAVRQHQSATLMAWLAGREGGLRRAGLARVSASGPTYSISSSEDMQALFGSINSAAGVPVNDTTAMQVSTVYACLSKLGGATTQLPIHQYRVNRIGDRERMEPTNLWWLLNESPSDAWTAASWKEWIMRCVGLRGDQITEIVRSQERVVGLRPLHPDCVKWQLDGGRLRYDAIDLETGRVYGLDQDDVLHFAGFGFNGVKSLSTIQYAARQAIGNSTAAADFTGRTLGEGAMPLIAITYPAKMDPPQQKMLRDSFVATYGGSQGRKLPLVLTEGATLKELSLTPVDIELMKLRAFEKADICEAFGVPPIIIGNSEKNSAWGTGIEQVILGFVRFTIKPHLVRWEEELNRKLFRRAGQFVEFELDGLLRGDAKSQADSFRAALGGPGTGDGYMSVNEVRKVKNMPPRPGGDALFKASTTPAAKAPPDEDNGEQEEPDDEEA